MKIVFTDGSTAWATGQDGKKKIPGGWAWISQYTGEYGSGGSTDAGSSNRMELMAVLEALREFPSERLIIVSDSDYVVHAIQRKQYVWWREHGWKRKGRDQSLAPLENADLWKAIAKILDARDDIKFRLVKSHSGNEMNDKADELARRELRRHRNLLKHLPVA